MTRLVTESPWLLDGAGNPLAPQSVIDELREVDPRLGLQYHKTLHAFMVTLRWGEDDPRREMIRVGQMPAHADFEILCPVPVDVSHDELRSWLAGQLRRVGQTREDVRQMVEQEERRLATLNAAVADNAAEAAKEELLESLTKPATRVGRRRTKVV